MKRRLHTFIAAGAAALAVGSMHAPAADNAKGAKGADRAIERGRYLVEITGCNDCHTQGFMANGGKVPESERLAGSSLGWRGPWGTTYAANLRLYFQDITEEQWLKIAKEIQRRPPMPYYSLNAMSQADARAVYRYIRHLGPAGKPAPSFVGNDREPPKPYVVFVSDSQ
ncbi:MAG TPA: cytochrome C [Burkholderiales bacterium]|nr:cytochrome C [Burkholderiales bacterium]